MKHLLLLLLTSVTALAADIKVTSMTQTTSPSTNSWLYVVDANASPADRKYLLTNLVTVATKGIAETLIGPGGPVVGGNMLMWADTTGTNVGTAVAGIQYIAPWGNGELNDLKTGTLTVTNEATFLSTVTMDSLDVTTLTADNWVLPVAETNKLVGIGISTNPVVATSAMVTNTLGRAISGTGPLAATSVTDAKAETATTITVSGTANEITSSAGAQDLSANRTWTLSLPTSIDLSGKTSFEIPNAAAPTTDAFGEIAGDNDAWAASRGAVQFFDGTANTYLVGVLSSDAPSNGQVPKWNTGGTITWEDDNSAAGTTYTSATGFLTTYDLLSATGVWGATAGMTAVGANTNVVYVCPIFNRRAFTIEGATYSVETQEAGMHAGVGIYDVSGNRLWYDTVSVTSQGTVTDNATDYTLAIGYYYLAFTTDSATAKLYGFAIGANDAFLINQGAGTKGMSTAANASSAGVPPATLGTLSEQTTYRAMPFVKFTN